MNSTKQPEVLRSVADMLDSEENGENLIVRALVEHLRDAANTIDRLDIENKKYKPAYNRCHDCPITCVKASYIAMSDANEQLRELVRLAVRDINIMALRMRNSDNKSTQTDCCFSCEYEAGNHDDDLYLGECPGYEEDDCFKWQHADKLKEMRVDV